MVIIKHSLLRVMILLPVIGALSTGYAAEKSDRLVGNIEKDLLRAVSLLHKVPTAKSDSKVKLASKSGGRIDLKDLEGLDLSAFTKPAKKRKKSKKTSSRKSKKISSGTYRKIMSTKRRSYRPCYKFGYQELQNRSKKYQQSISEASRLHGVNENLIKSVITAESCFKVRARSGKGARGLMQLMPATARRFGVKNSYSSHQNIRAGAEYLRWLLDRYKGNVHFALAGYNAGEGKVDRYGGIPPYKETREYVRRVMGVYKTLHTKRNHSFNEKSSSIQKKTRADYQRAWLKQQRAKQSGRPLNERRCVEAVPSHLRSLTGLKRSGRGGRIWRRYYQLRQRENLAHVMSKTGVHINAIKRMNHLTSKSTLSAGHKLLVWECRA